MIFPIAETFRSFKTHLVASVSLFVLSRFGKKKDDKSKDAAKASKNKLEALSEEELDRIPDHRDGYVSDVGGIRLCVGFSQFRVSKQRDLLHRKVLKEPESSHNHRTAFVSVVKRCD